MTSWLAEALAMPLFVAAGLLVIAGASKLRDPAPTGTVLRAVGVPRSRPAARFLGAAEVGAGAAAFAAPSAVTALVVATSYAAFASFLAYLIGRRISVRSCGCVGSRESPPTWTHIAVNLAAMIVAVMAA